MGFSEHIRFSNIPVLIIRIGNWKKGTTFHGDIIARFMYDERKFVWEVYAVTTPAATFFVRIELSFDDIIGMGFETHNEIAVLTLDFRNPPTFYQAEIIPHQPITWKPLAIDVSEGDIFTLRRHVLQFGKDSVVPPLQHLLKVEPRLHQLYESNMYQGQHTPHSMSTPIGVPSTPFANTQPHLIFSHDNISSHAPTFTNFDQAYNASQVPSHLNTSLNATLYSVSQQLTHSQKNTPLFYGGTPVSSEGEYGEDDDEEEMDQDNEEIDHQKDAPMGPSRLIPPNPTPHSFQHGHHDPAAAYFAQNYYTHQSLNSIPTLELDPKDEKLASAASNGRFMQPSPRYSVVVPGGMHPCVCGGNYTACACLKGFAQCGTMCVCTRYASTDGTASVPSSTPMGNYHVDINF